MRTETAIESIAAPGDGVIASVSSYRTEVGEPAKFVTLALNMATIHVDDKAASVALSREEATELAKALVRHLKGEVS